MKNITKRMKSDDTFKKKKLLNNPWNYKKNVTSEERKRIRQVALGIVG